MEFFDFLQSSDATSQVMIQDVVIRLLVALFLSVGVAITYRLTHKGVAYSYSLVVGIILVSLVVTMILMAIDNSIAQAFGLFGALSIIRFRTPVKDIKDMVFIFLSIAVGVACGAGAVKIALFGTFLICAVAYLLYFVKFGQVKQDQFLLKIISKPLDTERDDSIYDSVLTQYTNYFKIIEVRSLGASGLEIIYDFKLTNAKSMNRFISSLQKLDSVDQVFLLSAAHNLDLQ